MAVFYEMRDIAIACDHAPLQPGSVMVAVEASPDERVIYRFPYAEKQLRGQAPGGMIPASPKWLPTPAPDLGGELEPAIQCLLEYCWEPLQLPGPDDLSRRIESADAWLRHEGYRVGLTVRPE